MVNSIAHITQYIQNNQVLGEKALLQDISTCRVVLNIQSDRTEQRFVHFRTLRSFRTLQRHFCY